MGKRKYSGRVGSYGKPRWAMTREERAATKRGKLAFVPTTPNGGEVARVGAEAAREPELGSEVLYDEPEIAG